MKKLIALGILVTVLGAADQGARIFAENKLEERARAEVDGVGSVDASISSFPFLARLLVSGSVPRVQVRADKSELGNLLTAGVEVELRGVELDRNALFSGSVKLRDIDAGTVTVELDAAGLGRVLRVPVTIADGEVRVTVAGRTVAGRAAMSAGALLLEVSGLPAFRVPIARNGLINCTAANAEIKGDAIRLTCDVDEIPPALRR